MWEIEKRLSRKIWSHENREKWEQKGAGLINFRSRLEPNPISAEVEEKVRSFCADIRYSKE